MSDRLRALRTSLALSFRADPWRAVASALLRGASSSAGAISSVFMAAIVDGVLAQDRGRALDAAVWLVVISAVSMAAAMVALRLRFGVEERVSLYVDGRLIELGAGVATLEHHERPDYLDKTELLRQQRVQLGGTGGALIENVGSIFSLVTTVLLLGRVHPVLFALPLFALPSLVASGVAQQWMQAAGENSAADFRRAEHLYTVGTTPEAGKEVRVFGLAGELLSRFRSSWRAGEAQVSGASLKGAAVAAAGWAVFGLGYVGAVVFVVNEAVRGRATPGQVVLAVTLAAQVNSRFSQAAGMVTWFLSTLATVKRYLWLVDYAAEAAERGGDRAARAGGKSPAPDRLAHGIDFEGVSFTYPGTETPVIESLDLHLPAGSTVAVVGENGAGKTTLVKLLCRFYDPTAGRILVDGVDLAAVDVAEWRERLSGGFQDFARLELLARENVGVGHLPDLDDDGAVLAALDRASGRDVVDAMPAGLDTQLGPSFDDGIQLSGGQWQKLALGRALMRRRPLLLVLDEPTSALDAQTEHALFEQYATAASAAAASTGGITLLVSHRFSTVRMADLIVVVDEGGVREVGSHDQLVQAGGLYAELYGLQARSYS